MKRIKVIAGISLMAQSVLFFILLLVFWKKNKSLSKTFAVLSSVGGVCGTLLVLSEMKDRRLEKAMNREFEEFDRDFEEVFGPDDLNCSFSEE